jgi:hypothetical protein
MSKWVVLVFWVLVAGLGAEPSGKLMGATWCSSPSIAVASSTRKYSRVRTSHGTVCADVEPTPAEFNGAEGHVHLLVPHPPKVALSYLVNCLTGASPRRLRQDPGSPLTSSRT